ncbi:biotin--[acetyl-CoA-carboxylase] ligase [Corynebacterium aquilae]|uniref:Biotin--protein ligase n=1 Tax=Corynebacterium aquilae DSM 44791 TaxID=1431546 RepID=A0A1L7CE92_9CORY|nr:biotin--[acetyl-CoA-carboxylase] ligase [Corynebacterium aquilae]APT84169.1 biotin--protein ligase [Corynebacterium aquilae DSM 44791]
MTPRAPLNRERLTDALVHSGEYASVTVTDTAGSTNADLAAAGRDGAPAWTALLTEHQTAGRGRHGRPWVAPQGSQLTLSVLIRPGRQALERLGLLPLMTGLAIVDALTEFDDLSPMDITLKWPNDVLIDGGKLCGILGEAVDLGDKPCLVMGLGLNVSLTAEELPVAHATSLDLAARAHGIDLDIDRTELAIVVLRHMKKRLEQWSTGSGDPLGDYRRVCSSIGLDVSVHLPDHTELIGTVDTVDDAGHIVVVDETGERHALAAGDVTHLRKAHGGYSA